MKRTMLRVLGLTAIQISIVLAQVPQLMNFQGILRDGSGNLVANGSYSVLFTIYDAPTAGSAIWSQTYSVTTSNGLFTILLGSGATPIDDSTFNDSSRYLGIKVGADPEMFPRQRIASVGYSYVSSQWTSSAEDLFRSKGNVGIGTAPGSSVKLDVKDSSSNPSFSIGVESITDNSSSGNSLGLYSLATSNTGNAYGGSFYSSSTGGYSYGIYGSGADFGVYGTAGTGGTAVYGTTAGTNGIGVVGTAGASGDGVYGSAGVTGVKGDSPTGSGVTGTGPTGVTGYSATGTGVIANGGAFGVYGFSAGTAAVYGDINGNFGTWGGYFQGDVHVDRNLVVVGSVFKGGGGFKIDHPTDPANKYLYHSFVESPDMKNIYDGVVTMDAQGEAIVSLPEWFGAANGKFRYQLTCIGGFAPVYVADKINHNRFRIAGGTPGLEVSWQVTGIRQDAYANAHRIPVEQDKAASERGKYLHPNELGFSETLGMDYEESQELSAEHRKVADQQAQLEANRKQQEAPGSKLEH